MNITQLITQALRLAGRDDAADEIEGVGTQNISQPTQRLMRAFFTYINAVHGELTRNYFPMRATERLTSNDGSFALSALTRRPSRIMRVTDKDGKNLAYTMGNGCIYAAGNEVFVDYGYGLEPYTNYTSDAESKVPQISALMLEYGAVAEHFSVTGEASSAALWEGKYRAEIEAALAAERPKRARVGFRKWM